jgi:GMP synthase (glutamine-hydrolysing)
MTDKLHEQKILIIDYGSQYTQNIARKIREAQVYCEIHPCTMTWDDIQNTKPHGIILSGGPSSVLEPGAPLCDPRIFEMGIPVLGVCYGFQLITHLLQGKVDPADKREFGRASLLIPETSLLFEDVKNETTVWMSHGDRISKLPAGFKASAHTENSPIAAVENPERKIYGLQFHPEVVHTVEGRQILDNFLFRICQCERNWKMDSLAESTIEGVRVQAGNSRVICGLSGGVDSSVVAVLVHKAIGDHLTCIFIDNGLLRAGERNKVEKTFRDNFHFNLVVVDAEETFLTRLKGVTDPEQKRKIIGNVFIETFEAEAKKLGQFDFLAQGTLYPDVIESVSFKGGPSAVIKSHHNVGGLPEKMEMKLIEPLREFFKDEARLLGRELGIPEDILQRQPFPGPGLAIRILGAITHEALDVLRAADTILLEEIKKAGYYDKLWQSFMVLLPVKTVGVMGDSRTYENVAAIRAVTSADGMTADWARLPYELLGNISNRIINEVRGINRVVLDISSKPPGTIEWE